MEQEAPLGWAYWLWLKIDSIFDDGSLSTGNVRGNGNGWSTQLSAPGEVGLKFDAR